MNQTVERLTREILHYEDLAIEHAECAIRFRVEIGKRLNVAKTVLPHGQFLTWAESSFKMSRRHVQNHMLLARNAQRVASMPEDISLRMALEAVTPPKETPAGARSGGHHARLSITLHTGEQAVIEVRAGDLAAVCETLQARKILFKRLMAAKAA